MYCAVYNPLLQVEGKEMSVVAQAETEAEGTAVVRSGIKAGNEQVREDGR